MKAFKDIALQDTHNTFKRGMVIPNPTSKRYKNLRILGFYNDNGGMFAFCAEILVSGKQGGKCGWISINTNQIKQNQ